MTPPIPASPRLIQEGETQTQYRKLLRELTALAHLLLDAGTAGNVGAASSRCTTPYRRRRAGAFAAEFLLPETALERVSKGRVDVAADRTVFQALLGTYGVGARTAARHLYNRGWLSSRDPRGALIDGLAAREDL